MEDLSSQESFIQQIINFTLNQEQYHKISLAQFQFELHYFLVKQMYEIDLQKTDDNKNAVIDIVKNAPLKQKFLAIDIKPFVSLLQKIQSKIKYPVALTVVSLLTLNKEKSLSIILGFYYEILNAFIKQLKKDSDQKKRAVNKKLTQEQVAKAQEVNKFCSIWMLEVFYVLIECSNLNMGKIESKKQQQQRQIMSDVLMMHAKSESNIKLLSGIFKTSKILKIVSSLLCLPEKYQSPAQLLKGIYKLLENYSHSREILSKIQYKVANKLQQYKKDEFTQKDVILLLKILLYGINPEVGKILDELFGRDCYGSQSVIGQGQIFDKVPQSIETKHSEDLSFQSKKEKLSKMFDILSQSAWISKNPFNEQTSTNDQFNFGYHLTCFLIKIVSKQSFLKDKKLFPSSSLIKQIVFYISTEFLHKIYSFAVGNQNIKFYNAIISTLISQNDVFILKVCLNFVQNETILYFTVHKLKSLFKLLTDISKKLKKMDSSNKNESQKQLPSESNQNNEKQTKKIKQQECQINEQVELAKIKISRILRIFDQLSQRFKDKSPQIIFPSSSQSLLQLEKIKESNSLIFSMRINDRRKFKKNIANQENSSGKNVQSQITDQIRLFQFVLGKSETYEVFVSTKPSVMKNDALKNQKSLIFSESQQSRHLLDQILSQGTHSYTVEITIFQQKKLILKDQLRNIQKVADSYFQFTICLSCNKPTDSKGTILLIKINEKLLSISSKQKRNQITSFELGLSIDKASNITMPFDFIVKHMYFFSKQVPETLMMKNDFSSVSFSINNMVQFIGGIESINYRISTASEELIENFKKQDSLFFKKELKIARSCIQKRRSISFIEIFQQIGGLNSIFYILQKINKSYATHFGQKTQYFFIQLFKILRNVGSNDRQSFIFKELKSCYSYIFHFLILIFKRNEHLANQRNSLFVEAIFKFIMFFSSSFTKNEITKQYPLQEVLEMELTFIKEVLCNFQLWSQCSIEIQSYVFQTLQEGFVKNERYAYVLFPIDLHSKILSSVTFFYSQQPYNTLKNKFEQRILFLCEILYDKVISLLYDEKNNLENNYNLELLFNLLRKIVAKQSKEDLSFISQKLDKSQKIKGQNKQVTTKKDLIMLFERYVHRDVNETIGLMNLLFIYHSKHFHVNFPINQGGTTSPTSLSSKQQKLNPKMSMLSSSDTKKTPNSNNSSSVVNLPSSLRTCSNLLTYFLKNFVEKDQIFSKIGEDWGYVLGILTRFIEILLETRVQFKLIPLKKYTKISNSCQFHILSKILNLIFKIVSKNQSFFNYVMNSLEKIFTFKGLQLLESFQIASEIISLNKKYNFDIVETVFFLMNKKFDHLALNNYQREIIEFLSQNELEKILQKMTDSILTESRQFEEFMQKIQRQIMQMNNDLFMEHLVIEPFLTVLDTVETKQKVENLVEQKSSNKLQQQFTLVDILNQVNLLSKKKMLQASISKLDDGLKIPKSRQALTKVFQQYEDALFSICYETRSISLRNRQWLQGYFSRKYKQQKQKDLTQKVNLLKEKRINPQSNLLIAYFCSTQPTVNFIFDIFERNAFEKLQDQLLQKRTFLNRDSLKTIQQFSPVKQASNSYSSRLSSIAPSKQDFLIETQQQINERISSILNECEPVSFYLANSKLQFSQIILFNNFLEEKLNKSPQISSLIQKSSISLLTFVRFYLLGSSFSYLLEKYCYQQENASQVEKPMDAMKRKENTLNALDLIRKCIQNKQFQGEGFYNCLLNESQINNFKSQKILIFDKDNFPQDKRVKVQKSIQQNLKKFLQTWYVDTNKSVKINLHDKSQIKSPKKLNLQEKNIYDTFFDKIKFICFEIKNDDQKINELFTFMTENTRGNHSKQFLSFINKVIFTLKYTIESKFLLCVLQNYTLFNQSQFPISCPKNPFQVLSQKIILQYREQITIRFNKILQIERRKGQKCEKEYHKNEKENQFWLQIEEKEFERKDVIYEIDEKEMGPFGFYKLNIKPSQDRVQQIHYPRKKMFASINDSDESQENDQQENNDAQQSILLNRTRLIEMSMDNSYLEQKLQRRNTLLDINPIKSVLETGIQKNSILGGNQFNSNNKTTQFYCEWVTKRGVYAGKLVIRQEWIEFKYLSHFRLPDQLVFKMSTGKFHQINSLTEQERSSISAMRIPFKRCRMFTRRYILRHTAVELFSKVNHQSYFFNLFYQSERQNFIALTRQRFEECLQDRKQQFIRKQYMQQWKIGQLSNFQYLCLINQFSGRSTNDLAQYYVFPWVIANFDGKNGSKQIDEQFFKKKQNMRDLSCPPGKLSQQKFTKLKMRLMELDFCEPEERFLYGTMFSNPTVLYNFFIRLQPYIHLHWEHQGKRIDHADRLFSSIQEQFSSVLVASSDMKQLTPEFYYWPEFLKNRSYIDLGLKQNKQPVDDVILPIWAHTPEQFIFKMRQALESNVVSEHLHEWIDLTFGYQIKYENAEKFDNLYHFNCYERENDYFQEFNGDEKQIKSLQVAISEFGQIPEATFDEPHPRKNVRHEFLIIDRAIHVKYQKSNTSKAIDQSHNKRGFETCKEGLFVWTSTSVEFKKSYITQNYSYDQEHKVFPSMGGLAKLLSFEDQCWLTLNQGVLRIYLKRVLKFESSIEAQCIDVIGTYFVYSKKSSLFIGQYNGSANKLMNKKTLFGHKDEIIYLTYSKSLDLIISVDLEGFVIVHELQNLSFLRNFQLPLQKQWSRNDAQTDTSKQTMLKVQIHEMGYFIFLLNQRKLVIMTFLGQKFLEHDIEITSQIKGKKQEEKINDMLIFRQDRSILVTFFTLYKLFGTDKGNIYQIDFIEIKRYNQIFPYKTFANIHNNILELFIQQHQLSSSYVMKPIVSKKSSTHSQFVVSRPIQRMAIEKIAGDKISLYQLIVQYEDGEMLCFYQEKYLGKQLKQNEKLKQIGLFF